jgi:transcriptional regulator with XRE-family HTH domain
MRPQDLVKQLRAALGGLTQEKLAHAMSVTLRTIARYEDPTEGPGVEGLVHLYTMAKLHGFTDLATQFRTAALRTASLQQEADLKKLAQRIDETDSPETLAFVRKKLGEVWDDLCKPDLHVEPNVDDLVSAIELAKSDLEWIAERLYVNGLDGLIDGASR